MIILIMCLLVIFFLPIVSISLDVIIWLDKKVINKKYWKRISKRKRL